MAARLRAAFGAIVRAARIAAAHSLLAFIATCAALLLPIAGPPPASAQVQAAGNLSTCTSGCDPTSLASGSVSPGGQYGFRFRSGIGCDVTFSFCVPQGVGTMGMGMTVYDSTGTTELPGLSSACDTLSHLVWQAPYDGEFILSVSCGPLAAGGPFTLGYTCECTPVISFTSEPIAFQDHSTGFSAALTHSYTDNITSYEWTFGDGNSSSSTTASNTYTQDGRYDVTLTVRDDCGHAVSESREIVVLDCDANPNAPALRPVAALSSLEMPPPRRFSDDMRLTYSPGTEVLGFQSMATDTAGRVHFVYAVDRFQPYFVANEEASIYHRSWNPGSETWSAEELAAPLPITTEVRTVGVAADSLGGLHVVWSERPGDGLTEIRYVHKPAQGVWGAPVLLESLPYPLLETPVVASDQRGNVFVAWCEGNGIGSRVKYTVYRASGLGWLSPPQAIVVGANGLATNVRIAVQADIDSTFDIAHLAWSEIGGDEERVAHAMIMVRAADGQMHVSNPPDYIPTASPCGVTLGVSRQGVHLFFSNCFNGRPYSAMSAGGLRHYVGVTRAEEPNGWPDFELPLRELPSGMKGDFVSTVLPDSFGNLHAIVTTQYPFTRHAEWSARDSMWTTGDAVRDVSIGDWDLTTPMSLDRDLSVLTAWIDHRAPDSECSGEIYVDRGICTPPITPDSIRVANAGNGHALHLEWNVPSRATSSSCRYVILRALTTSAAYDSIADVVADEYLDNGPLIRGRSYKYRIHAYNDCGARADTSSPVIGIPRFPLVFVHGCCGGAGSTFIDMLTYLNTFGPQKYSATDLWLPEYDSWGTFMKGADSLETYIDTQVLPHYQSWYGVAADTVDIVAHSMGGLVSRVFTQGFRRHVGRLVTLGSPHAGTNMRVLTAAQLMSMLDHRQLAPGLFAMSYPNMLATNLWLNDTPLTLHPWVQCRPPSYHVAAGLSLWGGLIAGPNDLVVPLLSALFPVGCDQRVFAGISHHHLNEDTTTVGPWVRDRLLEDSLHVGFAPFLRAERAEVDSSALADSMALRPIALTAGHSLHAAESASDTVMVDNVSTAWFGTVHYDGIVGVTLRDPSGRLITPAEASSDTSVDFNEAYGSEEDLHVYEVRNPAPGPWVLTTTVTTLGPPSTPVIHYCAVESPVRADLVMPQQVLVAGTTVPILMRVASGVAPVTGCSVDATLVAPDGNASNVTLLDDGAHGDGAAGDGVYGSAPVSLSQNGNYAVQARAAGTAAPAGTFLRRSNGVLLVGDRLPPGIGLVAPNGGEVYPMQSSQLVRWAATDDTGIDSVSVELSLDDGGTWQWLGTAAGTDTAFAWMTPDTATARARIRVTAFDPLLQTGSDASAASFSLSAGVGVPPAGPGTTPSLGRAFPNPFRAATSLEFGVPQRAHVHIAVYDVAGRKVKTLVNEMRSPGRYLVGWRGDSDTGVQLSPGVYFVQLDVGSARLGRKLLILR